MLNFEYCSPTNYIFGKGRERETGSYIKPYTKKNKVLIVYDTERIAESGLLKAVTDSLEKEKIAWCKLSGVVPNPRFSLVKQGIDLVKQERADFVLGIGGGSVLDTAKAIGAGAAYAGDAWELCTGTYAESSLPIGAILTLAATGSEGSMFSVISDDKTGEKLGIVGEAIRPKFAVLNPELTYSLPAFQTACGACDMMSHIIENYFTNSKGGFMIDRLIEGLLKTVIEYTPIALREPNNYEARSALMWTSSLANNGSMGLGRISDTGIHAAAQAIGGKFDKTHGATIALVIPPIMKKMYKKNLGRYVQYASNVWGIEPNLDHPEETAWKGILKTQTFFKEIGLPTKLSDLGIINPAEYVDELTESVDMDMWEETPGYTVGISKEELREVFKETAE